MYKLSGLLFFAGLVLTVPSIAALLSLPEMPAFPAYYFARLILAGFALLGVSVWIMNRHA